MRGYVEYLEAGGEDSYEAFADHVASQADDIRELVSFEVHAWINPPRNGSDVYCGSTARVKDVTAITANVTCPACIKALDVE